MKHVKISAIVLMAIIGGFSACKKDDNSSSTSTTSSIVRQGNWRVTLFNDDGTDETNHFTGYTFTFNSNGTVSAIKSSSTVSGTWNSANDDSQNKLFLDFGTISPFDELNDDWHFIEKTTTKIRLEDVSGGNGGTDLLALEMN